MDSIERRAFVQGAATSVLAFTVVGGVPLSPVAALAQGMPLRILTDDEATTLEAVVEVLVPGARDAGIASFVDHQCTVPPHTALLSVRISNWRPPFVTFYRAALAEIDRQCHIKYGRRFIELNADEQREFIALMHQGQHTDWKAPPAQGAVYSTLRNDGVDVVYGRMQGLERLSSPHARQVTPTTRW